MMRAKHFATPFLATALFGMSVVPGAASGQEAPSQATTSEVGGATLYSNWNIVQNATKSPLHTTLIKAISTAGLVDELSAPGPFTLFAPTDKAFAAIPKMTGGLMNPANSEALAAVVNFHVVPGRLTSADLYKKIKAGGGTAVLTTVADEELKLTEVQGNIKIEGTQGSVGFITEPDVEQSNGMVHVVNGVLMPSLAQATS